LLRKVILIVAVVALLHVLSTAPAAWYPAVAVLFWALFGWVVLRAWPVCRQDVVSVAGWLGGRFGRRRKVGGF
jgi:hypothetical protein